MFNRGHVSKAGGESDYASTARRWSLATLALVGSITCFTVGHRLVSFTPGDPYCATDEFSCLGHPLVQGWESWVLPMGVGVILFAKFCYVLAHYELPTNFYYSRTGMRLRILAGRHQRVFSHMLLMSIEDYAGMMSIYVGIPAFVVTAISFLVWLGLGLSS